jgi:predicted CoA-substrate-specific enzyme activase
VKLYPVTRTSVELGGQDAKILFFSEDSGGQVKDMRMNGVCAGGTGAFLDQIASLLNIPIESFNDYASRGTKLYDISGRCGVFAKTDIQPLLNQGIPKEDIALSCLHALAKQTIGGLAQGMEIEKPLLFAGGPFFFMPKIIDVFKERLELSDSDYNFPDNAQTFIAYGTALALGTALGEGKANALSIDDAVETLSQRKKLRSKEESESDGGESPFFTGTEELDEFNKKYKIPTFEPYRAVEGETLEVYLGMDAGSTTTKFVAINEVGEVLYKFYQSNKGEPVDTARKGLLEFYDYYKKQGAEVVVKGFGSTGYGEHLFAKAFGGDYHTVETIAHKEAASFYEPGATFVLDLGGQDMKAIFIEDGVITDIVLNEACSAGCGSFIESYSNSLKIEPQDIAGLAFKANSPSTLGSRCTVFMNSSIISEQKSGKTVNEILAGLCKSVIENLFTKVIRIPNVEALGKHIVVQGGTFKNDAVLRALTQYAGVDVIRPPHAGEMGALGIALLTKAQRSDWEGSHFIGFDAIRELTYKAIDGDRCPFCANACARSVIKFSNGTNFVTGNRCDRGEVIGTPEKTEKPKVVKKKIPNMMREREKMLFVDYNKSFPAAQSKGDIGLPPVLDFYDSMPFWGTFLASLGYNVKLSRRSNYKVFEDGLKQIPSDTVCLPAKMVHGHFDYLKKQGVKRVFFPSVQKRLKDNPNLDDSWSCAVLMGYPEVIRISEFGTRAYDDIELLAPSFRWSNEKLKKDQIVLWAENALGENKKDIVKAIKDGDYAQHSFDKKLLARGQEILDNLDKTGEFGVLLAGRPYHGDSFINHGVADLFTAKGIPVIINEALPLERISLENSRVDTLNPFHSRMFAASHFVAENNNLELVQLVSFGCGHDAVVTDEVSRILKDRSNKALLSLKLDEGENKGPLNIRITSFVETVRSRRGLTEAEVRDGTDAYERKFIKDDKNLELLIPNLNRSFSLLMSEILQEQGYRTRVLPWANKDAMDLGKRFVHNDICFPAQINIGEHLEFLVNNKDDARNYGVMLAKNCNDCRAGHYAALARKALDANGFEEVPIITTDFNDRRNIHPGFKVNEVKFNLTFMRGLSLIDAIDDMHRKCRPYEKVVGSTDELHESALNRVIKALVYKGWKASRIELSKVIEDFNTLETNRENRRPRVGIIGEILVNFHNTGNYNIVEYLEQNGMEVVLPSLIEFWRQDAVNFKTEVEAKHTRGGKFKALQGKAVGGLFGSAINSVEKRMKSFKYYEPHSDIYEVAEKAKSVMDISFRAGEGWLIPGEILSWIDHGVMAHLIVQPFGCLPNHITGRGVTKAIKEKHPDATILSLDFDPDTSLANIHNRMQMIILNATGKM